MKGIYAFGLGCLLVVAACSEEKKGPSKEDLIADVAHYEDSLKTTKTVPAQNSAISVTYADKCLAVYRNFPKSEEAPAYLDKAHIILMTAGMSRIAVQYADTLIRKYPQYEYRPRVLESLASTYDMSITPRKKDMVEKYYKLLLKENPGMPKEDREAIQYRLDHIDLTFMEMIEQRQKDQPVNR